MSPRRSRQGLLLLRLATIIVSVLLLTDLMLSVAYFTECDRGDCGTAYDVATVAFYGLALVLGVLLGLQALRWLKRAHRGRNDG